LNDDWPTNIDNTVHIASGHVKSMIKNLAEDKLRYQLLHTAARITRSARRVRLRIADTWPWQHHLTTAFTRLTALPQPMT
jgi:hypothetical protein